MNPFLGVLLHCIGGVFHGSFYYPLTRVKNWKWESYWLLQGFSAWIVSPVLVAAILVPDLVGLFGESSLNHLLNPALFGFLWGLGSLTFGLTMRYLGMSLGYVNCTRFYYCVLGRLSLQYIQEISPCYLPLYQVGSYYRELWYAYPV